MERGSVKWSPAAGSLPSTMRALFCFVRCSTCAARPHRLPYRIAGRRRVSAALLSVSLFLQLSPLPPQPALVVVVVVVVSTAALQFTRSLVSKVSKSPDPRSQNGPKIQKGYTLHATRYPLPTTRTPHSLRSPCSLLSSLLPSAPFHCSPKVSIFLLHSTSMLALCPLLLCPSLSFSVLLSFSSLSLELAGVCLVDPGCYMWTHVSPVFKKLRERVTEPELLCPPPSPKTFRPALQQLGLRPSPSVQIF